MMSWGCPIYGIGGGSGWSLLGMLPGLIIFFGLLLVIVLSIVWLLRQGRLANVSIPSGRSMDPLSIARGRLAAGEITTAEFEEIRDRIQE